MTEAQLAAADAWIAKRFSFMVPHEGEDVDLSQARGPQALELDTGIEHARDVSVELDLRFPALPDAHRLRQHARRLS